MEVENEIDRLKDSYNALLELISRLQGTSSAHQRQELADSVQLRLKEYENGVQALEFLIDDDVDMDQRKMHLVALDRLRENLKLAKNRFRTAQMQAKKNSERTWKEERARLFGGYADKPKGDDPHNKELSTEERIINKSEDITNTLRRVHQMAQTEVVKSSLNVEELEYSTKTLGELEQKYTAFDVILNGSQRLVRHLEEADKWDRYYMLASLSFLALVLLWIIWRRILKVPTMLLLWTTGRMLGIVRVVTAPGVSKMLQSGATIVTDASETVSNIPQETASESISQLTSTFADNVTSTIAEVVEETVKSEL
ncbi:hypothetical protein TRICI_003994 [Trichomonascus ciferrii]|uniref:Sec20 C-terminal domain-containing protein n=1 Tax=Trichomonascus ciferrii TaxID=44093 RepID=A0A642V1P3_9ASCO|nr:hypothetical protein TRICI_003994 [Trichomonascus ciferrii]